MVSVISVCLFQKPLFDPFAFLQAFDGDACSKELSGVKSNDIDVDFNQDSVTAFVDGNLVCVQGLDVK